MSARQVRLPASARRLQLLDTCRALWDEGGFPAISTDQVAQRAGVSRTVIYQQFGGPDGMLQAFVEREAERARATFLTAAQLSRTPTEPEQLITSVLDAVDADPGTWRLFLLPAPGAPAELFEHIEQLREVQREQVLRALRQWRRGRLDIPARLFLAAAEESVRLHLSDPRTYPTRRLVAELTRIADALKA